MNNIALYVHYPFCVRKCPYCDFNSHKKDVNLEFEVDFFKKLKLEFDCFLEHFEHRKIISVFFGGGTPSLAPVFLIDDFIKHIRPYLSSDCEITLEANPNSSNYDKFSQLYDCGINRLSIGVQSFNDESLRLIGRAHNRADAIDACKSALKIPFNSVNFDIMHGLPKQNTSLALDDLHMANDLGCDHLSWYELTIEEGTVFYKKRPKLPEELVLNEIELLGFEFLQNSNFKRYEVSAFCKDKKCRHNQNYWLFDDYLGLGPGAHSKIFMHNQTYRRFNCQSPTEYMDSAFAELYKVDDKDVPFEFMLNRLRLFESWDINEFTQKTALKVDLIKNTIVKGKEQGLLEFDQNIISINNKGRLMLNQLLYDFID